MELKTGVVLEAEKHPDANKLLVLKVDTGDKVRTIVSGIAEHFSPEDIKGRKVCVVTNLKPAKLRGVLSEGMILAASDENGKLALVSAGENIAEGCEIK